MITKFRIYIKEGVEIAPNNTSGSAGDTSSKRDMDGFLKTGNDGGVGISFTPKGVDDEAKTYKNKKRKIKKFFRKNKKYKDEKHYNV
jgi:hypothetical protein